MWPKKVVGAFARFNQLEQAIGDLAAAGFDKTRTSMLGGEHASATLQRLGGELRPLQIGDARFAMTGTFAVAITAASLTLKADAKPGIAPLLAKWIDDENAALLENQVKQGRVLVWVRVLSDLELKLAEDIIAKDSGMTPVTHRVRYRGTPLVFDEPKSAT